MIKRCFRIFLLGAVCGLEWLTVVPSQAQEAVKQETAKEVEKREKEKPEKPEKQVTIDFNNVDLQVFIKFISELTGKNFIIDERVRGKVTIYSPSKIPLSRAYEVFLSVLELKGLTIVQSGLVYQVLPVSEVPPDRSIYVYTLEHTPSEEVAKVVIGLSSRGGLPPRKPSMLSGELSGAVQVLSDKMTNSLIITAMPQDYEILKGIIRKLDLRRRQVYVEALVVEMSADKSRELGADLSAVMGYSDFKQNVVALGTLNNKNPTAIFDFAKNTGVKLGKVNISEVLRALQASSDVNVLSTPQILASDGQKAELTVAENRPFPVGNSQTVGGNVQTTIERKDVGVILRLTPQVMENDLVKLDIYQEVSSVLDEGTLALGATTSKRSASTTVIVQHAQTVVIGGLIRDNLVITQRKIPLLGSIPFLGWLFKSQSRRVEKTNLFIFLTPHIVREPGDLEKIKVRKSEGTALFLKENALEEKALIQEMITPPR